MLTQLTPFLRPFQSDALTQGERSIALAYFGVAFFGGALGLNVVVSLGGAAALIAPFNAYDYWLMFSGVLGGIAGLFVGRDWMGHDGLAGIGRALIGIIWISFVGALVGGTLALPFYGTMFGPFIVIVTLLGAPLLAMLWAINLMGIHMLFGVYQRERDSIFTPVGMSTNDNPEALSARLRGRFV